MALTIEITLDDTDVEELVASYNASAATPITAEDFYDNRDEVMGIIREFLNDGVISLLEDENEAVYDMFADTFEPVDPFEYDFEDDIEIDEDQPRSH